MNLSIAKDQLLAGLQAVQNVVSTRTTLPILSNVLLRAEGNRVELTATDLDVTVTCAVEATVRTPGATTIPVKKLFGIARELASTEVDIEVDDKNTAAVRSGSSFFKIRGLGAEEFPPLPAFKEDRKVTLPQEKVKGILRKTSFAISTDESRYVLNGIFFSLKEHKLTMVATDGRRLALVEEEVDVPATSLGEFIVPVRFRWPLFGRIMSAMIEPVVTVIFALFVMASVWPTKYMMPEKVIVPLDNVSVEPLLVDG